ncbi:MAG: site-specific integrase [Pseudomonadota bacterium]
MTDTDPTPSSELIPFIEWDQLPALRLSSAAVSEHANPVDIMLADLTSPNSRRTYESRLDGVGRLLPVPMPARSIPWQNLRYEHVVAIKKALSDSGQSSASVNATIAALRKITEVCVRLKLMSRGDMMGVHDVKPLRTSRLPAGREVRIGELEAIIRRCLSSDNKAAAWRDVAIIGFLYICGLRRFEVAHIDVEDLDRENATLSLIGKGDKERLAYLDPGTMTAVKNWLVHRGDFGGPLFLPLRRSGKVIYDQGGVSPQTIYDVVKKRQRQAGVENCAPHDFRRSFGTELMRQGIDLPTVQRLMGHADPSTTARYDVRSAEEDRRATRGLQLPLTSDV